MFNKTHSLINSKILAGVVLAAGCIGTVLLTLADYESNLNNEETAAVKNLSQVRARVEESLYKRLNLVISLEAFVESYYDERCSSEANCGAFDESSQIFLESSFDYYTEALQSQVSGVLSLQLAPNGIVTFVSNYERNKESVNHDLLVDSNRREQAIRTIQERKIVVAGPLELIQGGEALIARKAIFTNPGVYTPQKYIQDYRAEPDTPWLQEIPDDFWGFITVLVNVNVLYEEAGLNTLNESNPQYIYAIRGRHGLGKEGDFFWGEANVFERPLLTQSILLPNGEWIIGVKLNTDKLWMNSLWVLAIGFSFSGLLSYSMTINADILKRKQAEEQLKASLQEKDILLKEIHHRVKNNLMVIASLMDWQSEVFSDPDFVHACEQSQKRIMSMALIHEHLFQSQDFTKINCAEYFTVLLDSLRAAYSLKETKINLKHELQLVFLNIETAVPCGLIVNELVSNSFDHGFTNKKNGQIEVILKYNDTGEVIIAVKDNGQGFPENFNPDSTETLGLQLVSLLSEQIEAKLTFITDSGLHASLAFTDSTYAK